MTRTTPDDKPAPAGRKKRVQDPDAHANPEAFDAGRAMTQSDFIVVYGPDKKILYVNPAMAAAMGYAAEEMAGMPLLPFIAKEFQKTMAADMAAIGEAGEPPFFETVLLAADGLRRSVIVKGRPVRYNNKPASLLFLIDITEKQVLEDMLRARAEELMQVSPALRDTGPVPGLSPAIRRDINDQLTVLKSCLAVLEPGQHDPALAGSCRKAIAAVDQIAALIRSSRD